jgi:hypothetical protein
MPKLRTWLLSAPIWALATAAWAAGAAPAAKPPPPSTPLGLFLGIGSLVVVGGAVVVLGVRSDLLRDGQPTDFGGAKPAKGVYRRPFSLAQTQMAWWFCLILAAYLYIAFTTSPDLSQFNVNGGIVEQSLILMGIGTGTALGATMIEQVKTPPDPGSTLGKFQIALGTLATDPTNAAALAARDALAPQLASQNFFSDILTDVNGISLHRFQAMVWTLVLGGMFATNVVTQKAMPVFNAELLGLLGISNGVYLGFKVPETPA